MCRAHDALDGGWRTDDRIERTDDEGKGVGGAPPLRQPSQNLVREPVVSSGVKFYPPSTSLWRIGGRWYDFTSFLDRHPGGAEVLLLSRDRFEDSTFAFEAHHHNYARARAIIKKYEVPPPPLLSQRPTDGSIPHAAGGVSGADRPPQLLGDGAFYSVLRQRLTEHLRKVGHANGGPTTECKVLFWGNFVAFCASWLLMYLSGSFAAALLFGFPSALLGAFGHNWVHQPQYRLWSYLSLDTIGFSSTGWFREHVLQHHMYTNTPWDNHFRGTDPFLVTDPTVKRSWVQQYVTPYMNPFILTFGLLGNYGAHLADMVKGNEEWRATKAILPLNVLLMIHRWHLRGVFLSYTWMALLGLWYFSLALMNHNAAHCMDVTRRNASCDWGEAQLASSADWGVHLTFRNAWRYLWLNYHTVHHLFPKLDFSHHPAAQSILMTTCREFNIRYVVPDSPLEIYKQMVHSFSTPQSLYKEIMVYAGGM
ncbi:hypothetical protein AB1Y20_016129 [Prymnesium parvum]|uniref:Cytochrome b5 heme-binding domain-containing protein n=1 Tax=Prymnesium parvum TaxID=97485 RepID=A0AB34K0F6_PRYPA